MIKVPEKSQIISEETEARRPTDAKWWHSTEREIIIAKNICIIVIWKKYALWFLYLTLSANRLLLKTMMGLVEVLFKLIFSGWLSHDSYSSFLLLFTHLESHLEKYEKKRKPNFWKDTIKFLHRPIQNENLKISAKDKLNKHGKAELASSFDWM